MRDSGDSPCCSVGDMRDGVGGKRKKQEKRKKKEKDSELSNFRLHMNDERDETHLTILPGWNGFCIALGF